jgi:hypothetical protein
LCNLCRVSAGRRFHLLAIHETASIKRNMPNAGPPKPALIRRAVTILMCATSPSGRVSSLSSGQYCTVYNVLSLAIASRLFNARSLCEGEPQVHGDDHDLRRVA